MVQYGVVSYGARDCGSLDDYDFFADVRLQLDWIKKHTSKALPIAVIIILFLNNFCEIERINFCCAKITLAKLCSSDLDRHYWLHLCTV